MSTTTRERRLVRLGLSLFLAAVVAACGGGDGGGDDGGNGDNGASDGGTDTGGGGSDGGGSDDSSGGDDSGSGGDGSAGGGTSAGDLQYYQGSLSAVSPDTAGAPVVVDADAATSNDTADDPDQGPVPFFGGTWNAGGVEGLQPESVVYAREDGTLWRVGTDGSGGTPTPVRVSSESGASPLCEASTGLDFANPDNARFAYGLGGSDCQGSLSWFMVRLGDGAGSDPEAMPGRPITPLIDAGDGSHDGFLSVVGDGLVRVAPDGSTSEVGGATVSDFAESLERLRAGQILLNIDGDLQVYDPGTNAVTDLGYTFPAPSFQPGGHPRPLRFTSDGEEFYWVENGQVLYRTDLDSSSVVALDAPNDVSAFDFGSVTGVLAVGNERVGWSYRRDPDPQVPGDETTVIRTVAKTGGTPSDLDELELATTITAPLLQNTGGWIFYNELVTDGGTPRPVAIAARLDGNGEVRESNALWVGAGVSSISAAGNTRTPIDRLYRVEGLAGISADHGGHALVSVPANDPGGTSVNLGTLPADVQFFTGLLGFGPYRIATGVLDDGSDILFFDETQAGSLVRVTDTPDVDEIPVPFF